MTQESESLNIITMFQIQPPESPEIPGGHHLLWKVLLIPEREKTQSGCICNLIYHQMNNHIFET